MTGLLSTSGKLFEDWTADYRLYSQDRVNLEQVFHTVFREIVSMQTPRSPLVAALDDTTLPKYGKKIPGVRYARDPMGPRFRINLIRGQRIVQLSAALHQSGEASRMVPVLVKDAALPAKPKKWAPPEEWESYKAECKEKSLGRYGVSGIQQLRSQMDQLGQKDRPLWVCVDGGYTNRTVIRGLPERTVLIGRIREDAKLYWPAVSLRVQQAGRKAVYGPQAPTPKEIRQDDSKEWQTVRALAAGKFHDFRIKTVDALRWRPAGTATTVRIIVIAPLHYRLTQKSRLLYRNPAYLICTDPGADLQKVLQAYLWRWDIEVNFRDEKTLLGVGQAQVRNAKSVAAMPQMMVAAYSLLLLAAIRVFGIAGTCRDLPTPKWQSHKLKRRMTTSDMIKVLRGELWGQAIQNANFSGFAEHQTTITKPFLSNDGVFSAMVYALG